MGGGVADFLYRTDLNTNNTKFVGRWLFDLFFFFLVNLVLLNIVSGIIIDAFAKKRETEQNRTLDRRDNCPICGLSRDKFERYRINFNKHINCHHEIWKYVNFLIYLETKNPKEYNALEQNIVELVENNNTKWMPNAKTEYLAKGKKDKEDKVNEDVGALIASSRVKLKSLKREARDLAVGFKDIAIKVKDKIQH